MSLISDVRQELAGLDASRRSLRKFGLVVGGVFLALALFFHLRGHLPSLRMIFASAGAMLAAAGAVAPTALRGVQRVWMAMAFVMGWMVSRLILTVLFYLVVTPIGLAARLAGKRFMDVRSDHRAESYWVKRDGQRKGSYEKMY